MPEETMDCVGSLKKVARELAELSKGEMSQPDTLNRIGAAAWLINYIAEGLDRELAHGAVRAQKFRRRQLGIAE